MENLKRILRFLGRLVFVLLVGAVVVLAASGQSAGTNKPLGLLLALMGAYQLLGAVGIVPAAVKVTDKRQAVLLAIVPIALGVFLFVSGSVVPGS
jgi:hypothetical protein